VMFAGRVFAELRQPLAATAGSVLGKNYWKWQ